MKIWLDDICNALGWIHYKWPKEVITYMQKAYVSEITLGDVNSVKENRQEMFFYGLKNK